MSAAAALTGPLCAPSQPEAATGAGAPVSSPAPDWPSGAAFALAIPFALLFWIAVIVWLLA